MLLRTRCPFGFLRLSPAMCPLGAFLQLQARASAATTTPPWLRPSAGLALAVVRWVPQAVLFNCRGRRDGRPVSRLLLSSVLTWRERNAFVLEDKRRRWRSRLHPPEWHIPWASGSACALARGETRSRGRCAPRSLTALPIQGLTAFYKEDLSLEFPDENIFSKERNYP